MKTFVHTLAFNTPEMVKLAGENLRVTAGLDSDRYTYVIVDCGYPLPSKEKNTIELKRIANKLKAEYIQIKNEGVAQNWNQVIEVMGIGYDDIIVGVDPDSRADTFGWLQDMRQAFRDYEDAFYIGMNRYNFEQGTRIEKGIPVLHYPYLISWSMGGFRVSAIKAIGGLGQHNARYGYIEHYCYEKLKPMGFDFYMLADHYDLSLDSPDSLYTEWKKSSSSRNTDLTFEEWLRSR